MRTPTQSSFPYKVKRAVNHRPFKFWGSQGISYSHHLQNELKPLPAVGGSVYVHGYPTCKVLQGQRFSKSWQHRACCYFERNAVAQTPAISCGFLPLSPPTVGLADCSGKWTKETPPYLGSRLLSELWWEHYAWTELISPLDQPQRKGNCFLECQWGGAITFRY